MNISEGIKIEVEQVQGITPHNKALYEAGKKLLIDSVDVGREFCKFMITTTLGAIPIYLALLKLVLSKEYSFKSSDEFTFLVPPLFFLLSSVFFVIGYFPKTGSLSLDLPYEIELQRSATIRWRHRFSILAFSIFCIGVIYGTYLFVGRLKLST